MSEPAAFVIIRDGQTRYYSDHWASLYLHRELVWGPEALEKWVETLDELADWSDETDAAVIMDTDKLRLIVCFTDVLGVPKVDALYERLLTTAWPGYAIILVASPQELGEILGVSEPWEQEPLARLEDRVPSVRYAASYDDDEDDDEDEDEDEMDDDDDWDQDGENGRGNDDDVENDHQRDANVVANEFDADEQRAWITIVDSQGVISHRQLVELPSDLLQGKPRAIEELSALPACEVPPERVVIEGMWIDRAHRTLGIWGSYKTQLILPVVESAWRGWNVQWAPRGYAQQCETTGPVGEELSIEEALGQLVPELLSTDRANPSQVISAIGSAMKRTAMKGTGCLVLVLCLPVLIFGAVTGYWTGVLITIGITIALAALAFKTIEWAVRSKFRSTMLDIEAQNNSTIPPSAGPLDKTERRKALDQLLSAARLPAISQIEPYFKPLNWLGMRD